MEMVHFFWSSHIVASERMKCCQHNCMVSATSFIHKGSFSG